jgi:hypothetical protein
MKTSTGDRVAGFPVHARATWIAVLVAAAVPVSSFAQLPGSDIWIARLEVTPTAVAIRDPANATRRPGYDNQPFFLDAGGFLYSAGDSASSTDVWRLDPAGGPAVPVTRTPESEFSPTPLPDGAGFCAVRVEADSTQRLWRFDLDGGGARPVLAGVDSVGYFEWIDPATLALFVVGEPHTLRIVDVASGRESVAARDIGRFIRCVPGTRDVAFTLRVSDDAYRFVRLPAAGGGGPVPLIDGVGGQDAAWVGDVLLATAGTRIFASRPFADGVWREVADAGTWGVAGVTRLAVSPDQRRLAVVCAE